MKCPRCSLSNPDTQRFCGECGTRLIMDPEGEAPRTETIRLPGIDLTTGSTFAARYRIIEELGKGGMGRVYRALDQKLNEEIAIKFIRPEIARETESIRRFRTELRTARKVVHRNVARMFDLNEEESVPYITMEYVKGENLKNLIDKVGRLSAQQAVPIAKQVAEGLAEAHRLGVIHRDLKPQNIMIDEQGTARITDFGIARLQKTDDATATVAVMGTPAYVSPEQVEGFPADSRSDLYSLGIVLYEMLTGKPAFQADSPYSIALKHVSEVAPDPRSVNPEIAQNLSRVVMKCLEKDPEKRYQNAAELIMDLEALEEGFTTGFIPAPQPDRGVGSVRKWVMAWRMPLAFLAVIALGIGGIFIYEKFFTRPKPSWKISLAVLPVVNLSPQEDSEYLWYGLQSDMSAKLTSIPELRVIPMLSLSAHDYSGKDYRAIGNEIGADYLLKLTLQTEGTRLKVRVELIEAKSNSVIKFYAYEPDPEDIYSLQDEISRYTARALHVNLVEDRLRSYKKRETANLEAYNCYWEGYRIIEQVYPLSHRPEDFDQAVKMYERAIDLDPKYALAYWGLGNAYEARYYRERNPKDLKMMRESYLQAHSIDPDFAETHLGLGWVYFNMTDDANASESFRRALTLNPDKFIVNNDVGAFLRSVGLHDKAIKYYSRAAEINPKSASIHTMISSCRMYLGDFEKAVGEIKKALSLDPDSLEARYYCVSELIMSGRLDEAEKEFEVALEMDPEGKAMTLPRALLSAARGEKEKALALISGKDSINVNVACVYIFLGMKEQAMRTIEEGIERGFEEQGHYLYSYPMLAKNKIFKPLRNETRFQEILRRQKASYEEKLKSFAKI